MPEDLNKHFSPKSGENLGKQSWLTEDAHFVNILVSIVLLKIQCQKLSKLIFSRFFKNFICIIFVTKQTKKIIHQIEKQIENHHTTEKLW